MRFRPATLLKKGLQHKCFPVDFVKFKNTFFTEHLWVTASDSAYHQEDFANNFTLNQGFLKSCKKLILFCASADILPTSLENAICFCFSEVTADLFSICHTKL